MAKLKYFESWEELTSSASQPEILGWVNELYRVRESQAAMGKRYRTKQRVLAKLALEHLSPDELEQIKLRAAEMAEEMR